MKANQNLKSSSLPPQYWLIALIALINSISFTIIIPLLYPYAKQFGLSDFEASLLTTAYAISQFLGTPILGKLADRLGRRPILIISLAGTVVASLLASVATVAWLLYVARILDGLTGANNSVAQSVISDITTPAQRPQAFGIFGAMFRLGFVIGPTLSYLAQQLPTLPGISSLGMSFVVAAAIATLATILTIFCLPETLTVKQNFHLSWQDFDFGRIAKSATRPKLGQLFILTFLSGATFTIFTFAFQPFFLNVLNQNAKGLAIVFAVIGMLGFIAQVFIVEPLRKRFNLINILSVALLIRGITFLLMPTFPSLTAFAIIITIFGIANSFPMPLIDSVLSLNTGRGEQGEILGINASYLSMANAIGPAISGILVSIDYKTPLWITGALTILTAWFALNLKTQFKCEQKV
ncbi:major facilitator superfamily MFS_1 [Stanieria cyanosphaera PCC 7437]|uniref:Major facilitator superfamily MFS_1 n=1 Tax=Stanieria cyanosphaera (strain ATCC 29371 / PCC 7437) TaxID=111780 RepID=K9XUZ2_STAC7|nr:MFS transporter [Stanieria cyanosphaera]AFZ35879.1 major facilitator superfamily MFS_1 [Stanieria cyanosphaera PCC 7437]